MSLCSGWVEALAVIKFDAREGQQCVGLFSPGGLREEILHDVRMQSMPDCIHRDGPHVSQFFIRVRNKFRGFQQKDEKKPKNKNNTYAVQSPHSNQMAEPVFYNGYVIFKRWKSEVDTRGYVQRSIVLLSRLPFANLFYLVANRLDEVLSSLEEFKNIEYVRPQVPLSNEEDILISRVGSETLVTSLETTYQHFLIWPRINGDSGQLLDPTSSPTGDLFLPFYGDIIHFGLPQLPEYAFQGLPSASSAVNNEVAHWHRKDIESTVGMANSAFDCSVSLICVLAPIGLLQHIHTLWHSLMNGCSIVVIGMSAEAAASVVVALNTLCTPLTAIMSASREYGSDSHAFDAAQVDFRPYINGFDADIDLLARSGTTPGRQVVVGITNPFLLRSFENFDLAIFVPACAGSFPSETDKGDQSSSSGSNFLFFSSPVPELALKRKVDSTEPGPPKAPGHWLCCPDSKALSKLVSQSGTAIDVVTKSFDKQFDTWISSLKGQLVGQESLSVSGKKGPAAALCRLRGGRLDGQIPRPPSFEKVIRLVLSMSCESPSSAVQPEERTSVVATRTNLHEESAFDDWARSRTIARSGSAHTALALSGCCDRIVSGDVLLKSHFREQSRALLRPAEGFLLPSQGSLGTGPQQGSGWVYRDPLLFLPPLDDAAAERMVALSESPKLSRAFFCSPLFKVWFNIRRTLAAELLREEVVLLSAFLSVDDCLSLLSDEGIKCRENGLKELELRVSNMLRNWRSFCVTDSSECLKRNGLEFTEVRLEVTCLMETLLDHVINELKKIESGNKESI
jgi:hypothetical protein